MKHHTERMPELAPERHAQFVPLLSLRSDFSGSSTHGAAYASPGQRPGVASPWDPALKGRPNGWHAPSGLGLPSGIEPRALPWAIASGPFGARHRRIARTCCFSRNAAEGESPGYNPGHIAPIISSALKGTDNTPQWFAESAALKQSIKANMKGLSYGG
jgi:hypothetical protein